LRLYLKVRRKARIFWLTRLVTPMLWRYVNCTVWWFCFTIYFQAGIDDWMWEPSYPHPSTCSWNSCTEKRRKWRDRYNLWVNCRYAVYKGRHIDLCSPHCSLLGIGNLFSAFFYVLEKFDWSYCILTLWIYKFIYLIINENVCMYLQLPCWGVNSYRPIEDSQYLLQATCLQTWQ
jgi:hypothetical protein